MDNERHQYEITGIDKIGDPDEPIETIIAAYNPQQAREFANRANIVVKKTKDLGTVLKD